MTEKEISFQDKQGRKIVGTLIVPDRAGPFPAVILCHGFKGNQNEKHIKSLAERITSLGLVTLRFDFTKEPGKSSLPFEEMTVSYELEVLDEAVRYIKSIEEVDSERIGITGHSLGGLVVSWYSAGHLDIKSLATLSAVYSFSEIFKGKYEDWLVQSQEKGFGYVYSSSLNSNLKLLRSFYDDGINYEMDKVIEKVNCPVLVVCGTNDRLLNHSQRYLDRLQVKTKDLKVIKGADHGYSEQEHLNQVVESVSNWFAETL